MSRPVSIAMVTQKVDSDPTSEQFEDTRLASYLRALGQAHRVNILRALVQSELCACELEELIGVSASLLAHHLKVLRKSGLIHVRRGTRDARWLYYSVKHDALVELEGLFTATFPPGGLPPRAQCGSNCSCG